MKICPECNKEYDNTWKVCLKCGVQLSEAANSGVSGEQLLKFARDTDMEFQKINSRLDKIEKSLGIETSASEKARMIEPPAAVKAVEAQAPQVKAGKIPEKKDIESTIGLVWLNRIGLLALFLGVAFFLKYAFGNRWIGELGQVILGLMAGFGMIVGSEFTRRKNYTVISQGLHGGGVGILYLSIFAAFGFYHLIGAIPAFAFMSAVTLYCGIWSTHTDWVSSAVIGLIGGFLTPFLVGMDKIAPSMLLSYVVLLDLGIVFISFYKNWKALNIGSFFLTCLVYFSWYAKSYKQDDWLFAASFATVFFGIFCLLSILRNLIHKEKSDEVDIGLILSNGIAYFLCLFNILKPYSGSLPGLLPVTLGCVYIGYSYSALSRRKEDKGLVLSYVGLAVFFATIAIPVQLKYNWVVISWAIESVILISMGFWLGYADIRKIGLGIGALSIIKALMFDYSYDPFIYAKDTFIFNERMFTYLAIVFFVFLAAWLYRKNKENITPDERSIATFLVLLANFVLIVQFSVEAKTYFAHISSMNAAAQSGVDMKAASISRTAFNIEYVKSFGARELSLSLLWLVYAFIIVAIGMYRKFRAIRLMALTLFGLAILKIFMLDLSQLDKVYRIISFIALGVILIVASFFYQKYKNGIRDFALKDK